MHKDFRRRFQSFGHTIIRRISVLAEISFETFKFIASFVTHNLFLDISTHRNGNIVGSSKLEEMRLTMTSSIMFTW